MPNVAAARAVQDQDRSLLDIVSERVRVLRALRGISRKILATRAQVSERHLAQIEGGTGNVSIRLLGQIATALGVSAGELLAPQQEPSASTLLHEVIEALTPQQQQRAIELIRAEIAPSAQTTRFVSLIGLRGAGKSTLGQKLAAQHNLPFLNITQLIEQRAGMHVAEIHSLSGQLGYRRHEQQAIADALARTTGGIIEAGGSVVANPTAFNVLLQKSLVVWVQTSPEEHMGRVVAQGDLRPIEGSNDAMDDLLAMLSARAPLYAQAHVCIDTSNSTIAQSFKDLRATTKSRLQPNS